MPLARLFDPWLLTLTLLVVALAALRGHLADTPAARRRWRVALFAAALAALLSAPVTGIALVRGWELAPPDLTALRRAIDPATTALVVLSSSSLLPVPGVPASERLDPVCLARTLGAARLFRSLEPAAVIVTGTAGGAHPDATVRAMEELLVREGVPRARVLREPEATNTRENARRSVAMARARGLSHLVVVTSGLHMRRALWEFRRTGHAVSAASVDVLGPVAWSVATFVPTSGAPARVDAVVHEALGFFRP